MGKAKFNFQTGPIIAEWTATPKKDRRELDGLTIDALDMLTQSGDFKYLLDAEGNALNKPTRDFFNALARANPSYTGAMMYAARYAPIGASQGIRQKIEQLRQKTAPGIELTNG